MAVPALSKKLPLLFSRAPRLPMAAAFRSLSTHPNGREHWSAPFRRHLGIGDSPVVFGDPLGFMPWIPPSKGELKINLYVLQRKAYGEGAAIDGGGPGLIMVLARNSSGDVVGATYSSKHFVVDFGLALYALKAAGNLTKVLKDRGYHRGPVVYESTDLLLTTCFHEKCKGEVAECLEGSMPDDLEDLGKLCKTHIGDPEQLLKKLSVEFPGFSTVIRY